MESGCRNVAFSQGGDPPRSADFLRGLPELEAIRLVGRITEDEAVLAQPGVRSLRIATRPTSALDFSKLPRLEVLETEWRPGIEGVHELRDLSELTVFGWRDPDLGLIGEKAHLQFIRIRAMQRRHLSLAGLRGAPNLETLWIENGFLTEIEEIGRCQEIREIRFVGSKIGHLEFVRQLPALSEIWLENCGNITDLEPLRGHLRLERLTIIGRTRIQSGDLSPLDSCVRLGRSD